MSTEEKNLSQLHNFAKSRGSSLIFAIAIITIFGALATFFLAVVPTNYSPIIDLNEVLTKVYHKDFEKVLENKSRAENFILSVNPIVKEWVEDTIDHQSSTSGKSIGAYLKDKNYHSLATTDSTDGIYLKFDYNKKSFKIILSDLQTIENETTGTIALSGKWDIKDIQGKDILVNFDPSFETKDYPLPVSPTSNSP